MEEEKKEVKAVEKLNEEVDKSINKVIQQGVQTSNVDFLYKMIDIKKDIAEIEKEEQEMMYGNYRNYGNYGNYGRNDEMSYGGGRRRDSRGRYMESGRDSSYRGHDMLDEMHEYYGNYMDGRERYGADNETLKSFEYMLKSFKDYYKHLKKEASSPQEVKMLEETAREMLDM